MKQAFAPGFRLSVLDGFVLVVGTAAAIVLLVFVWWWGFVAVFVLAHFFLFCVRGASRAAARARMGRCLLPAGRKGRGG